MVSAECQCCCNQEGKDSSVSLLPKSLGKLFLCFKPVLHQIWWQSRPERAAQKQSMNAALLNVGGQSEHHALWHPGVAGQFLLVGIGCASLHEAELSASSTVENYYFP